MLWSIPACADAAGNFDSASDSFGAIAFVRKDAIGDACS
jgi:hypothetical protein